MAGPSRPVITLNKAMTHTQVYILSRLTVSRDHTRKTDLPEQKLPPPPTPRYQHLCDVAPPPAISNLQPPPPPPPPPPQSPSPSPGNFPLMTTALKDLTLKAARHWVVNLILRIIFIIIIYPIVWLTVGAPLLDFTTSFLHSSWFSTFRYMIFQGQSTLWCCLPIISSVCLFVSLLELCPVG